MIENVILCLSTAGAGEVVNGFSNIEYMQDMSTEICSAAKENDTKQLIDRRDNNKYWVTKLKDGNCWMTQNLAYDDGASSFSMPSSWGSDNTARKYYNPGLFVYTTPTTQNQCPNTGAGLSACTGNGWVNVAGWTASDDPNYASVVDTTNKIYNAHYLSGNYYSYMAATAGSAPSAAGTATSSICPTGWQLPTSNSTTASKSFGYLVTQYGLQSNVTANGNDLRLAPLYFVYGGWVYGSSLQYAGGSGNYWSSTAYDSGSAYVLAFTTSVNPSFANARYAGYSVRCVAR